MPPPTDAHFQAAEAHELSSDSSRLEAALGEISPEGAGSSADLFFNPSPSARLFADLTAWAWERGEQASHDEDAARNNPIRTNFVVALTGQLIVAPSSGAKPARRLSLGQYHHSVDEEPLVVRSAAPGGSTYLASMDDFLELCSLYQVAKLFRPRIRKRLTLTTGALPTHCVWVSGQAAHRGVSVATFAHLLAASIAGQFDEPAVVVELGESRPARVSSYSGQTFSDHGSLHETPTLAAVRAIPGIPPNLTHALYVRSRAPEVVPASLEALRFDRIVHVGDRLKLDAIPRLTALLKEAAQNPDDPEDPYFSSFVPTFADSDRFQNLRKFREDAFDRFTPDWRDRPTHWRLTRDACWLDFNPSVFAREWHAWDARRASGPTFAGRLCAADPAMRDQLDRWARATTNRQVGLALSGGGASSYRFLPALERFCAPGEPTASGVPRETMPIDVVSGVSGGALVGAYFCANGIEGCKQFVDDGWKFQLALLTFALSSTTLEWLIDYSIGSGSIAELDRRYVPVAVCLVRGKPPETRVILRWSVGKAVRASGSLPLGFGPSVIDGERYADGTFGTVIPAQVVSLYGADFVVAMNCIAGPALGDTLNSSSIAHAIRRFTPVGRVIDLFISIAYLLEEAGHLIGQVPYVHELIEPEPSVVPFEEAVRFACGSGIAKTAESDPIFMGGVETCINHWQSFRDDPEDCPWKFEPPKKGNVTMASLISELLSTTELEALRDAYDRPRTVDLLENKTPKVYERAHPYFSAIVDTFYKDEPTRNDRGQRIALDIKDRQRCILALQAGTGQTSPLAIHIYISLMEGLTVDEIANILLLAGAYTGVPHFFTSLDTLGTTLALLKGLAAKPTRQERGPDAAVQAIQDAYKTKGPAPDSLAAKVAAAHGLDGLMRIL